MANIIKTFGHITNANGTFDVCLVEHLGDLWLATYDPVDDEIDTLSIVNDLDDAIQQANYQFQSQPEYVVELSTGTSTKRTFTKYPSNYVGAASETSGAAMRKNKRRFQGEPTPEEAQLLAKEGGLELWQPLTFEGSVKLGRLGDTGTDFDARARWDTCYEGGGPRWFNMYNDIGPLYIMVNRNNPREKYQYWAGSGYEATLADIYDNILTADEMDAFFAEHPQFAQIVNYNEG